MTPEAQRLIQEFVAALGLPKVGQITINMDDAGTVQSVESRQIFRRSAVARKVVDSRGPVGA